jgi:hypothetical protein
MDIILDSGSPAKFKGGVIVGAFADGTRNPGSVSSFRVPTG